jgi:hypothetical protein
MSNTSYHKKGGQVRSLGAILRGRKGFNPDRTTLLAEFVFPVPAPCDKLPHPNDFGRRLARTTKGAE